jgi:phosphoglycerate kinase
VEKVSPKVLKVAKNRKVLLPIDVLVKSGSKTSLKEIKDLEPEDQIVDLGPASVKLFASKIKDAETVLWNGPLGVVETGFSSATVSLAKALPAGAYSVLGGGDSVEALRQAKLLKKFSFVSTGGGALLDYLSRGTLPGLKALK